MLDTRALSKAGARLTGWMYQYPGLRGHWRVTAHGLRLDAQRGPREVSRLLAYHLIEQEPDAALMRVEEEVIALLPAPDVEAPWQG